MVAIHQPDHMPWMGFFHKMHCVDTFIILDNVQFKKNNFQNRNRIYTSNGVLWCTIPVKMKGHMSNTIMKTETVDGWLKKYIKTLYFTYKKSPFFHEINPLLDDLQTDNSKMLVDINMKIIQYFIDLLKIETKIIYSSNLDNQGQKSDLLIHLIKQVNGTKYLSGRGGLDYLDESVFNENKIELIIQQFKHIQYQPFNYPELTDYPGIIDVVANLGSNTTRAYLEAERNKKSLL